MPIIEIPVFLLVILMTIFAVGYFFVNLRQKTIHGKSSFRLALGSYGLITFTSPLLAYLIIFLTSNFINKRPSRFTENLSGSIWNGDASFIVFYTILGLYALVVFANIIFVISLSGNQKLKQVDD